MRSEALTRGKCSASLIMFQNIVPISLVITVELVKTLQALFIFQVRTFVPLAQSTRADADLLHPRTSTCTTSRCALPTVRCETDADPHPQLDHPCVPKTWNISDDLGQIEYVFSDKTGTLTQNVMEF